ncbi:hypothetical protein [Ovoidimarina sediminis]|uniref:hypothetical protein n=1 Tax=Ovoidimarina sediminis TaxID=3079856 RepID=UPI00290E4908|nr:hypothetical protein [Rhodophyticola sp. MJ-SS7]MDU8946163.1 hypothetical protein [Rhodophyticola sp. MJ-SS7]
MELTWRTAWFESKAWVKEALGVSEEVLHVHLGLAVFLGLALLLRRRRFGVALAWLILLCLQALNEALDARDWIMWTGDVNWRETLADFAQTLFWPTVLLLLWHLRALRGRGA